MPAFAVLVVGERRTHLQRGWGTGEDKRICRDLDVDARLEVVVDVGNWQSTPPWCIAW